jgi:hypothetical protein
MGLMLSFMIQNEIATIKGENDYLIDDAYRALTKIFNIDYNESFDNPRDFILKAVEIQWELDIMEDEQDYSDYNTELSESGLSDAEAAPLLEIWRDKRDAERDAEAERDGITKKDV